MTPKNIKISDFTYCLPDESVAKYPLANRDESNLLVYSNGRIKGNLYRNLADEIPENSLLVFNNTKVVEARLFFAKSTGSIIEIFCLEPSEMYADISIAMLQKNKVQWKCLVGGAKKWKDEILSKTIINNGTDLVLTATKLEKLNDYFLIEISWTNTNLTFAEVLHIAGEIPLPPYLNRDVEEKDKETYQTIYAKQDGSVAAPTAGLHFTPAVFSSLKNKNIDADFITLHVGAGTFKPVKADTMEDHEMHTEFIEITVSIIEKILNKLDQKIIAVGTTSLRTIESLYWLGVKLICEFENNEYEFIKPQLLEIKQWDAYDLPQNIESRKALQCLLNWMRDNNIVKLTAKTQIIIAPGYQLKIADGLITNFHQPKSTLLLLIAAIVGNEWKNIYSYALQNNYRFLSYGDGSLLWNTNNS